MLTPTVIAVAQHLESNPGLDVNDSNVVAGVLAVVNGRRFREIWVTPESLPARLRPLLVAQGRTELEAVAEASTITAILLGVLEGAGASNPLVKMAYQRLATSDKGINVGDAATQAMLSQFGADTQIPNFTVEMAALVSSIGQAHPEATAADVAAAAQYIARTLETEPIREAVQAQFRREADAATLKAETLKAPILAYIAGDSDVVGVTVDAQTGEVTAAS